MSVSFRQVQFTQELYNSLVQQDYKYILIWDAHIEGAVHNYVFVPVQDMPAVPGYSCTSIKDEMIRNIVHGRVQGVSATIKIPAE